MSLGCAQLGQPCVRTWVDNAQVVKRIRRRLPGSVNNNGGRSPWRPPMAVPRDKVMHYESLQGDDFRHPLDQQNTSMLRSIPGLEVISKTFLGPAAEQVLLLENIGTSIKIGPAQMPSVHKLLVEAAEMLQMDAPDLYVRQNPIPNAYTLAIAGRQPFIVIHTALLELLTPRELQAVLAHELGHLKCDHGVWLTIANVLASGTVSVLPVISGIVEEALFRWLRAAELTCDRAALLVAQDSKVVVASLMKLAGGSPSFASELNVEAFLEQARSYDEATNNIIGWYLRNAQTRALSHPLPVMRAREIDRWAQTAEYKTLLSKNRAHRLHSVEHASPSQGAASSPTNSFGTAAEQPGFDSAAQNAGAKSGRTNASNVSTVSSAIWGSPPLGSSKQGRPPAAITSNVSVSNIWSFLKLGQ